MNMGLNREPIRKPRKNLLPPFSDEGWIPSDPNAVLEKSIQEDGISFRNKEGSWYASLYYEFTDLSSLRGRTVTVSVKERSPFPTNLQFNLQKGDGTWIYQGSFTKSNTIDVPIDAKVLQVRIQANQQASSYHFVSGIMLEHGHVPSLHEGYEVAPKESRQALKLDGVNSYLKTDRILNEITHNGRYTIEAVIKINETSDGILIQNSHGGSDRNGIAIVDKKVILGYYTDSWHGVGDEIPTNEYVHIIAVNDGGAMKMFINGQKTTQSRSLYVHTMNDGMYIGKQTLINPDRTPVSVDISSIRVFNYPFSDDEALMSHRGVSYQKGKVLELDFANQDVNSSIAVDSSSNGNHATLYEGARYTHRPSVKKPFKNIVPPLEEWSYKGGARYENGMAILDGYGATISSPIVDVRHTLDGSRIVADFYGFENSPTSLFDNEDGLKTGMYGGSSYFDDNMNPIANIHGHTGNGHAKITGDSGVWNRYGWSMTMGRQIRYVRYTYATHSSYTPSVLRIKNVIAKNHTGIPDDYEEYRPLPTRLKELSKKRASATKYPFSFKRDSLDTRLDDAIVGYNQPVISADGIRVEESSKNLLSPDGLSFENGWRPNGGAVATLEQDVDVPEWGTQKATRIRTTGGTSNIKYYRTIIAPSVRDVHYSMSVYMKNVGTHPVRFRPNLGTTTVVEPNESKWIAVTATGNGSSNFQMMFAVDDASKDIDIIVWRPMGQVKKYPLSFSEREKSVEEMQIPSFNDYIDEERGSIEIDVKPVVQRDASTEMLHRFHDICYYNAGGGFILGRNNGVIDFYSHDGSSLYSDRSNALTYELGDTLKFRIEWSKSENKTRLFLNGVRIASIPLFHPINASLFIGGRDDINAGRGNAYYKNFIVRDRWGKTTYKI